MTVKETHLLRRALVRAVCVGGVVSLATFGSIASASAATSHFTPVSASPVTVGAQPKGVAYNPNPNAATNHPTMFVANYDDGTVSMIDAVTQVTLSTTMLTPHVPTKKTTGPESVAVDTTDNFVYVGNYDDSSVSVLNGSTSVEARPPVSVGTNAETAAVAWDSSLDIIYVANYAANTVVALSGIDGSFIRSIHVDDGPIALAFDSKTKRLFVVSANRQKLDVIEANATTSSTVASLDLSDPMGIGIDSQEGLAYVANSSNSSVTVVDTTTMQTVGSPIGVADGPIGVGVDEESQTVYVSNSNSDNVSVIDETTQALAVAGSFAVGMHPLGVAVDPQTHTAWVTNQDDGTVSVVQQSVSPTITSGQPTAGTVGAPYSFTFTATGVSTSPMTLSLAGNLPAGLTFSNGVISGTPTAQGDFVVRLTASNGVDPDDTATYRLHIDPAAVVPPTSPPTAPPTTTPTTTPSTSTPTDPHLPTVAG